MPSMHASPATILLPIMITELTYFATTIPLPSAVTVTRPEYKNVSFQNRTIATKQKGEEVACHGGGQCMREEVLLPLTLDVSYDGTSV
mmetsp:Transcript_45134/g.67030  ORF Transcript_45134/g.67030 Transcript_45134/m.67030 type:complete len:88 (+) Transcript_45134:89-352(+)